MRSKTPLILLLLIAFTIGPESRALAYQRIPDYLCDAGARLMENGNYQEALVQFQKALVVEPDFARAKQYIELIQHRMASEQTVAAADKLGTTLSRTDLISSYLDNIQAVQSGKAPAQAAVTATPQGRTAQGPAAAAAPRKTLILTLDENLKSLRMPLQVERGSQLVVRGQNVSRYIVTQPNIMRADKLTPDQLTLTATDFGYTYLHVWDARNRWTIEVLGIPEKPSGPTLDEEMLTAEERARSFRLRYVLDWSQYNLGPDMHNLHRSYYSWNHALTLDGQTPYGLLDSTINIRDVRTSTDVTYFTIGLQNGSWGDFQDFDVRIFDFYPNLTNLAFSGGTYRGAMLESPVFNHLLDYTIFWGQQAGGRYGFLSPGLSSNQDYYVQGAGLSLLPGGGNLLQVSAFRGYGADRPDNVNEYGFDAKARAQAEHINLEYEAGYDSQNFSHLASTTLLVPNLRSTLEFRDTAKEFTTLTGTGWRAGEIGGLSSTSWRVTDKLEVGNRLDVYQNRLFPNPEHTGKLNEDWTIDASYTASDYTSFRSDYSLSNDVGTVSPTRSHNAGAGISQGFDLWTRVNTYLNYRYISTENLESQLNDYVDNKVILGLSMRLIADLFVYANKEYNWLDAKYYDERTNPNAFETGFDWNTDILNSPFYLDLRLTYRTENDTQSPVSLLAGEDYIEYYGELAYRPRPDIEAFYSARLRNVFHGESETFEKRLELNLYAGLRLNWDTGFRWEPVGEIFGCVFNDRNGDGLKQDSEKPMAGIKVAMGKLTAETDSKGYYYFEKIKALKASVSILPESIPGGYVLTTPQVQQVDIRHGGFTTLDFGMNSRTEIIGMVFIDTNGNKRFDKGEKGLKGVTINLEDGSKTRTDDMGRYFFRQASVGRHKVTLDLTTLPTAFLPAVPVFSEIDLTEGSSYVYNFPLKQIAEQ